MALPYATSRKVEERVVRRLTPIPTLTPIPHVPEFSRDRVVGEDDFFADLGISYKDFDMPDEVDDYYDAKEDPEIAKDA